MEKKYKKLLFNALLVVFVFTIFPISSHAAVDSSSAQEFALDINQVDLKKENMIYYGNTEFEGVQIDIYLYKLTDNVLYPQNLNLLDMALYSTLADNEIVHISMQNIMPVNDVGIIGITYSGGDFPFLFSTEGFYIGDTYIESGTYSFFYFIGDDILYGCVGFMYYPFIDLTGYQYYSRNYDAEVLYNPNDFQIYELFGNKYVLLTENRIDYSDFVENYQIAFTNNNLLDRTVVKSSKEYLINPMATGVSWDSGFVVGMEEDNILIALYDVENYPFFPAPGIYAKVDFDSKNLFLSGVDLIYKDKDSSISIVFDSLSYPLKWTGTVIASLFGGELSGLSILFAVSISISALLVSLKVTRKNSWGSR